MASGTSGGSRPENRARRTRAFVSWSIVVGSVLTAGLTVLVVGFGLYLHAALANPTDAKIQPFETALEQQGATRVCGAGDPGLGPDNLIPWSTMYYLVPNGSRISDRLRRTAEEEGYSLHPQVLVSEESPLPDEALSDGDCLEIWVYRNVDEPLACYDTVHWGETRRADVEAAIVMVMVQLPSRPID